MDDIKLMLQELRPEVDFASSKDFVSDGLLDSFDVISLVTMLEDHFEIMIDALDILPENFSQVEAISELVEKNRSTM